MGSEETAPTIIQKPRLSQEDDGNKLIFTCKLVSNPVPNVIWFRDEHQLEDNDRTTIKISEFEPHKFIVSLELNDVQEEDAGIYKITAKNKKGEVAASINLNFSPPEDEPQEPQKGGEAPSFSKKPSLRQEDDGRRLLFECKILADPKPSIAWFHDNNPVVAKGRFKVKVDQDGNSYASVLEIQDVNNEDAGKYKVIATNALGESSATISLNFDNDEAPEPAEKAKPTFTEKPIIRQSPDNKKIIFECRLVADPKPTLEWFHAGKPVKDGGQYKYVLTPDKKGYIASLEISNVEAKNGGEYKVVAKNKNGEGSANINLNFDDKKAKPSDGKPPRFPKKPTIRQLDESLVLECILEAKPFPQITWFHGTNLLKDGPRHKSFKKDTGVDTYLVAMEIMDPETEDGGNYRCNAVSPLGESNANIALNFEGGDSEKEEAPPTFIQKPKIIPKEGGKLIVMECKVSSETKIKVTWYRGTTIVKETSRIKSMVTESGKEEYTVVLEIRDPAKEDGGTYKCNIANEDGNINANLNLNIEGAKAPEGEAPTFVEKPKIISEDDGKRIILECKVRAKPQPSITWYKETTVVKESTRIKQTVKAEKDVYIIRMEIKAVELTDAGIYKCNVKNSAGESNANLTLNIELAPVIREKPKIIRRERHERIVIECRVASNGKPDCQWFKETSVVKQDSRHIVHIREVAKGEFAVALEIEKPLVADKGIYKLMAKNEKGEVVSTPIQVDIDEPPEEKKKEPEKKPKGEKPKVVSGLQPLTVESGKSAEFVCKIMSKEKTTVTWYQNKKVIRETRETRIVFDGTTARLTILKATSEYSGTYTIEFVNEYGKEESSATLTVKDPPKKKEEEKKPEEKKPEVKKPEEKKPEEKKAELKKPELKKPEEKKPEEKKAVGLKKRIPPPKEPEQKGKPVKKKEKPAEEPKPEEPETPVPKISIEEPIKMKPERPEAVMIIREPTPEPVSRKDSLGTPGGSRRGSLLIEPPPTSGSRRPSLIIADEKGIAVDETGKTKKLRPGEMVESRQRRRSSVDMRRASVAELQELIDRPNTPLKPIPEDSEGPPVITDYQENVTACEGKTAYISVCVEGNPVPTMRFFKGVTEIYEGGRYHISFDGECNNTVALCIRKAKTEDEGKYTIQANNKHGEDSVNIALFVSDESGMDFRAMLRHRQYAKWGLGKDDPDFKLKKEEAKPEIPKLIKKQDMFIKPLENQSVKEARDKMVRFEAVFSKNNVKGKWFKNKQELFLGKKYHMSSKGDLHVLEIINPTIEDSAKYTLTCLETSTMATLEVEDADPVYKFVKKLPKLSEQYTTKDAVLECTTNTHKAPVKWYKGNKQIENSVHYAIECDTMGRKILRILDCVLEDSDVYTCKISAEETTVTKLTVTEQMFQFMKGLKSMKVTENDKVILECEVDEWEARVSWFKGDKRVTADKRVEILQEGRKRRLIIKKVKVIDEGEYYCKTNSDSTRGELIVEPLNKFGKKLQDTTAMERDKAVLEVEMLDRKAPMQWFKNGEPLKISDRIFVKCLDSGIHTLTISKCEMDDAGQYSIESKDLKCSCKLTITEAEKAPVINTKQKDFTSDAGKPFVIEIPYSVKGCKQSEVIGKLTRKGQPVNTKEVEVVVKPDKVIITFRKATRPSTSPYEFTLSNAQGEAKLPMNVVILDAPSPPEGPLEVTEVFRDRCKLAWKPSQDNGGCPPVQYIIERQDLGVRGGWMEVAKTDKTKFDCTDMVHRKEYKFRVRAVNEKGSSEPLVAPKTTLAKDPYDEPSKPGNVQVVDWDKEHVDLKWEKPEKDGGSPITGYIIEFKDKFSTEFTTAMEVGPDALKTRVKGLKEGVEYEFRVRAVNAAGPGEPSDATKPVICKARFVKPYIIGDGLKPMIVKKGQLIKYDINFGGEPPPELKWCVNRKEIQISPRITIESTTKNTVLTIKSAERGDSGTMALALTNSTGQAVSEADLVVLDRPTSPLGPLEVEEVYAEHVQLSWSPPKDTGGQDLKGYVLEKMDMDTGRWVPAGEVGPKATKAKIEGLTPKKKYKFRVKAVNKDGESEPLELDKPLLAKNPYDEPGKPGQPKIVDYDNTRVDLKWAAPPTDGGRPITHYIVEMKDRFSVEWTEVLKTEDNKPEVTIPNLKENAVVQFRIKAVNIGGASEPSDPTEPHTVKHRNLKPYIDRTNLKTVVVKVGRSHKFEVDIRGEPPPEVVWSFKEGVKVSSDDHIKIENKDYHSDFTITNALRKHSGIYTITASNANGKDSATVDLTVLGKPARPEGPLNVSDVHAEGCKLTWNKPKDDGGVPLKGYEIEKLDKETGRWTRCGRSDKPEFEVTGLTPGKEYLFRVAAQNEEGDSEPLESLKTTLAKNPYDEPGKPGVPVFVDWDNVSVQMKWDPPKSDGGAPITRYIIEKKEKFGINWERAAEVPGDKCEATVVDLKERQEYQFRVVAVNKAGPGEPSDPTNNHMVKHRRLKPFIDRTNLDTVTVKKGKPIRLDVNVRGEPPPKITWMLKSQPVESKNNVEIINVDYNTKLNITDSVRSNTGLYTIIAENEVGRDEAEVELVVLGAPSRCLLITF